jgi:pre-mRNA-splicing factor 38A
MTHQVDGRRMLDERGYSGALIHGENPAHLLEKAVRERIVDSYYWKEQCFGVNEATLCDRAAAVTCVGGTYGQQKPTPFLCLALKLLQLLPGRDIVLEYLRQPDFKYLAALAAFYIRLTWEPRDVYATLEPMLLDYRKLRRRNREGRFALTHLDQFVDDLLTKERVCGTSLKKLPNRSVLEDLGYLEPRESPLGDEIDRSDEEEEEGEEGEEGEGEEKANGTASEGGSD